MQRADERGPDVQVECDACGCVGYIEVLPVLLPQAQLFEAFGDGESSVEWVVHASPASFFKIPQQNGALDHTTEMSAGCLARYYVLVGEISDDLDEELWR